MRNASKGFGKVCAFGGRQEVWQHDCTSTGTPMKFGIYLPPQALKAVVA